MWQPAKWKCDINKKQTTGEYCVALVANLVAISSLSVYLATFGTQGCYKCQGSWYCGDTDWLQWGRNLWIGAFRDSSWDVVRTTSNRLIFTCHKWANIISHTQYLSESSNNFKCSFSWVCISLMQYTISSDWKWLGFAELMSSCLTVQFRSYFIF